MTYTYFPNHPDRSADRAAINRANAQHSTGPRTPEGKARSSRNATCHGLSSRTAVLASEDPAVYERHCRQFFDEYHPATPTETHLTQELADTAWRLHRIPALEADLLDRAANPPDEAARIAFDIVDAHQALAKLALYSHRLSRQFQKTLETLRTIQAERMERHERDLKHAASLLQLNKHKGLPYNPAQDGFVFSCEALEAFADRQLRHSDAHLLQFIQSQGAQQRLRASAASAR